MEEPDEDSSRAVHALPWDKDMRRGILSGSPRLAARRKVVVGRKEREGNSEIGVKTSGYGRPSTSSAITASHRIARGTVSGAHGSGAGGTRTTPDQRYRAMEIITPPAVPHGREEDRRGRVCPRPSRAGAGHGTSLPPRTRFFPVSGRVVSLASTAVPSITSPVPTAILTIILAAVASRRSARRGGIGLVTSVIPAPVPVAIATVITRVITSAALISPRTAPLGGFFMTWGRSTIIATASAIIPLSGRARILVSTFARPMFSSTLPLALRASRAPSAVLNRSSSRRGATHLPHERSEAHPGEDPTHRCRHLAGHSRRGHPRNR